MVSTAIYVYCIVHRARRPSLRQVPAGLPDAAPPEIAAAGGPLWLVVAEVPLDSYGAEPTERMLRDLNRVAEIAVAHERVVDHFRRQADATVVPMKVFTLFSSRERAIQDVHARRAAVGSLVRRIRGCEEWGVRVNRPAARTARWTDRQRPTSGTAFLVARKQVRDGVRQDAQRAVRAAEEALKLLAGIAKETKTRRDAPEGALSPPLLEAAFLVSHARKARFQAVAKRAAARCRDAGTELTLTGPWPAYNFVQQEGNRR